MIFSRKTLMKRESAIINYSSLLVYARFHHKYFKSMVNLSKADACNAPPSIFLDISSKLSHFFTSVYFSITVYVCLLSVHQLCSLYVHYCHVRSVMFFSCEIFGSQGTSENSTIVPPPPPSSFQRSWIFPLRHSVPFINSKLSQRS